MKLKDKVAIITGASRGIGKAMALGFAEEGAIIVIAARTETPRAKLPGAIGETAKEVGAKGARALAVRCDITDEGSVAEMVNSAIAAFGRIDILVNNAGAATYQPLLETEIRIWDKIMATNVRGTFLCCRFVLPHMVEQRAGSIINISSHAADSIFSMTVPKDQQAPRTLMGLAYGTSKAAIQRLSVGLAAEVGKYNVAVNALKPSRAVLTEGMAVNLPEADKSQWASPANMVKAAIFLAQQDAKGVTGQVSVDDELILAHGL